MRATAGVRANRLSSSDCRAPPSRATTSSESQSDRDTVAPSASACASAGMQQGSQIGSDAVIGEVDEARAREGAVELEVSESFTGSGSPSVWVAALAEVRYGSDAEYAAR
jgi:hypothetical protein